MIRVVVLAVSFIVSLGILGIGQTLTVLQTASTNHREIRVRIDGKSKAMVIGSDAQTRTIRYDIRERKHFFKILSAAGPLASLPTSHCFKSASFGYGLFVEVDGERSPDLSCESQADPRAAALRAQAQKVLQVAGRQR